MPKPSLSVGVMMVQVRVMRVDVRDSIVGVLMGMRLIIAIGRSMLMLVMRIMLVTVLVEEQFVDML
ncbi:MAG: hypothetical protein ACM3VW_05470, partial [Bacteroidota bacterium]